MNQIITSVQSLYFCKVASHLFLHLRLLHLISSWSSLSSFLGLNDHWFFPLLWRRHWVCMISINYLQQYNSSICLSISEFSFWLRQQHILNTFLICGSAAFCMHTIPYCIYCLCNFTLYLMFLNLVSIPLFCAFNVQTNKGNLSFSLQYYSRHSLIRAYDPLKSAILDFLQGFNRHN